MLNRTAASNARTSPSLARLGALALAASLSACAYGSGSNDVDRNPIANTGAGASIIYPGRGAPTFQTGGQYGPRGGVIGAGQPGEVSGGSAPGAAPGGAAHGQSSGSPDGGGGSVSFLGGGEQDEVSHESYKNEPYIVKAFAVPFAMLATPFKAAYDAARGKPEAGPEVPRSTQTSRLPEATSPAPPNQDLGQAARAGGAAAVASRAPAPSRPRDYESVLLEKMEHELARRTAAPSGRQDTASPILSFADELAALQRTAPAPVQRPRHAGPPSPAPRTGAAVPLTVSRPGGDAPFEKAALARADGIVDRNGDGRIDQWLYRENGRLAREILDDDFDGQAERTIHYDVASSQVTLIEEDFDRDGVVDSWTNYRAGRVVRRRSDVDHDGVVDSWTYYRDGEISRHERDTTGDGFRDRVGHYRAGRLDFEEQDHDGDGRADVTVRYDASEQIASREEDLNADGVVDLISHFENGRLTSRELLDASALDRNAAVRR